jgi:aryl-alcohol dehydrogenase-like predicted oxidoreductase
MERPNWGRRRLGRTELQVTPLGIGGAYLGRIRGGPPDERTAVETVLRGLELGLNLIDTSPKYLGGVSERFVGLALQEWYARGGAREDLVLSTKVGSRVRPHCYTYDHAMSSIETSLELLQEDSVDLMLVHDPQDLDPVFAPDGALAALLELQAQGVIGHIGLGCRPHAFHRRCHESGAFEVSLTFGDYNLLRQSAAEGVLASAAAHDVGVLNATVNLLGLLAGRDPREVARAHAGRRAWSWDGEGDPVAFAHRLWAWCGARGVSMLALNLQYSMRQSKIASTLIGFSRPSRVDEDLAAAQEPIDDGVWNALHEEFGL